VCQFAVGLPTARLVEHNELDARQVADELMLEPADDPGQAPVGACAAQGVHQRQHVGHVAQRGQAEQAEAGVVWQHRDGIHERDSTPPPAYRGALQALH